FAQPLIHRDEPLLRGAEDDGMLAAPAVRIGMRDLLVRDESAVLAQQLDDLRIRLEDMQSGPQRYVLREFAAMIHRRIDLESVAAARVEVIRAVTRRGVHEPGSRFQRHVVAEDEDAFAIEEGVAIAKMLERRALESLHDLVVVAPAR